MELTIDEILSQLTERGRVEFDLATTKARLIRANETVSELQQTISDSQEQGVKDNGQRIKK